VRLNIVAWMIVADEIAFWIVIILGLIARYLFRRDRLGMFFLAMVPVVDVILLITAGLDIYYGTIPSTVHAIAAVYLGVSIAFGKNMINWADERFRYYIAKEG